MRSMKRKGCDSAGVVIKKEPEVDDRLDRRLKRRSIANQHFKLSSNHGKSSGVGQCSHPPTDDKNKNKNKNNNTPVRNYIIIDSDDNEESCDLDYNTFLGCLALGEFSDMDASDNDDARFIDNCSVDVNGSLENGANDDDVAVNDENVDVRSVDCGTVGIRSIDDKPADGSPDDDTVSIRTVDDGGIGDASDGSPDGDPVSIRTVDDGGIGDASHEDNDVVDGSPDNGIVGDDTIDDDDNNVDAKFIDDDGHHTHDNDACDRSDPQYKMFLENVREDGKSFVLEIPISNEMSILIKYEAYNRPLDRCNMEKPETNRDHPVTENTKTKSFLNRCSSAERMETQSDPRRERMETQRKLGDVPARGRKSLVLERNAKKEVVDRISSRVDGFVRPSAASPGSRRETVETQRKVRNAPVQETMSSVVERKLKKDVADPISCRGNGGAGPSAAALGSRRETMETQRKVRDIPAREKMSSAVETKLKKDAVDPVSCRVKGGTRPSAADPCARPISFRANGRASPRASTLGSGRDRKETQRKVWDVPARERVSSEVETKPKKEAVDPIYCTANGCARKRPSPEALTSTTCKRKREMEPDMVDQEYQSFLNCLNRDGRYSVFMPERGKQVIYEKDEQSSSDSEVMIMDTNPFCDGNYTPFVASKEYFLIDEDDKDHSENFGKNEISLLRERLIQILQKPYDEKEYEELWEEVSHMGQVTRDRHLRHRSVTYQTQDIGKSYLDQQKDLANEIHAAGCDRPKILNLLRGFFFWLKYVSHQGMFKPWLDATFLKVRPHHC